MTLSPARQISQDASCAAADGSVGSDKQDPIGSAAASEPSAESAATTGEAATKSAPANAAEQSFRKCSDYSGDTRSRRRSNNPAGVQEAQTAPVGENIIEAVEFRGQRKVPQDTLRALIYTKKGDVYDEESLHRDFIALWNTGRFDDLKIEKEKGPAGGVILRFVVTERRTVHTIDYTGNKSISKSEILDRLKERKVSLTPESQYDPGKVQRAKNVLQEYEAERGHQYATVTPQIRQVPPGGVDVTFAIDEGPKVKVGHIIIDGNTAFTDRQVIRAMKNLKPIGLPHSLLFENLFARTYDSTKLDEDSDRIRQFYQTHGYFTARVINHSEKIYDIHGQRHQDSSFQSEKAGQARRRHDGGAGRGSVHPAQLPVRRYEAVPYSRPDWPAGLQDGDRAMSSQRRSCRKDSKTYESSTGISATSISCPRLIPKWSLVSRRSI